MGATAQKGIGFSPDGKSRQGDRFGGGAKIGGDDTGISRTVCTVIGKKALCNIQADQQDHDSLRPQAPPLSPRRRPTAFRGVCRTLECPTALFPIAAPCPLSVCFVA